MKVRNKDRKFDIQKVEITKHNGNGCKIELICNNQYIELLFNYSYIDSIFEELKKYIDLISDDNIYYKI